MNRRGFLGLLALLVPFRRKAPEPFVQTIRNGPQVMETYFASLPKETVIGYWSVSGSLDPNPIRYFKTGA